MYVCMYAFICTWYEKVVDGMLPSSSRWESTWDGIHYAMLLHEDDLRMNSTCPGKFLKGGRHMCGLNQYPAVNHCKTETGSAFSTTDSSNTVRTGWGASNGYGAESHMYWCRKHVDRSHDLITHFEGGVSRMMTMIWLNSICNQ